MTNPLPAFIEQDYCDGPTTEAIPGPETPAARLLRVYRTVESGQHLINADAFFLWEMYHEMASAMTWETACLNCANVLNHSIEEFNRREEAEAEVERLRAALADRRAKVVMENTCPECKTGILYPTPALDMPAGERAPKGEASVCNACGTVVFK